MSDLIPVVDYHGAPIPPPFTINVPGAKNPLTFIDWLDALTTWLKINRRGSAVQLTIQGFHPSHDMQPWVADLQACSVCQAAEGDIGAVYPCGYIIAGRAPSRIMLDENMARSAGGGTR